MPRSIAFTSSLAAPHRAALEELLFFNTRQDRVQPGILDAIERFGLPEIYVAGGKLRVRVADLPEVQSLYALDQEVDRPVGVLVYVRLAADSIVVIHIGVAEEYSSEGEFAGDMLMLKMLGKLRALAHKISGVSSIELMYGRGARRRLRV